MATASSAMRTCNASSSASEWTATVAIPMRRAVRMTRHAISPRLAISILENTRAAPALAPAGLVDQIVDLALLPVAREPGEPLVGLQRVHADRQPPAEEWVEEPRLSGDAEVDDE